MDGTQGPCTGQTTGPIKLLKVSLRRLFAKIEFQVADSPELAIAVNVGSLQDFRQLQKYFFMLHGIWVQHACEEAPTDREAARIWSNAVGDAIAAEGAAKMICFPRLDPPLTTVTGFLEGPLTWVKYPAAPGTEVAQAMLAMECPACGVQCYEMWQFDHPIGRSVETVCDECLATFLARPATRKMMDGSPEWIKCCLHEFEPGTFAFRPAKNGGN